MAKLIDMTGWRFGRLTVIRRAGTYAFPMQGAVRKRTIAQVLLEEAEKDLARGRQMLEEAKDAETLPLERG